MVEWLWSHSPSRIKPSRIKQIFQLVSQILFSQPHMPCCRCLPTSSLHVLGTFGYPLNSVGGGWGFSRMVATFSHVGGSFDIFMATTGGVLIIPSFRIWGYLLHVEYISCVITNCGQHQWTIPSLFSIALEDLLEETLPGNYYHVTFLIVTFLIFFSMAIFSPYFFRLVCYCRVRLYFSQGTSQ